MAGHRWLEPHDPDEGWDTPTEEDVAEMLGEEGLVSGVSLGGPLPGDEDGEDGGLLKLRTKTPEELGREEGSFNAYLQSQGGKAKLRGGGTITKVMRHGDLADELRNITRAFWGRWVRQADVVLLNMGHHYHNKDPAFRRYGEMVQMALRSFGQHMKPTAQLVFRTTNVGHHGCQRDARPLESPREAWQRLTTSKDIYEWNPPQAHTWK